jgi:hypothetical protein
LPIWLRVRVMDRKRIALHSQTGKAYQNMQASF